MIELIRELFKRIRDQRKEIFALAEMSIPEKK
jgi:hypothetical protein